MEPIRFLVNSANAHGCYRRGQVVPFDEAAAAELVASGVAEYVLPRVAPETAALGPAETAVLPPARPATRSRSRKTR